MGSSGSTIGNIGRVLHPLPGLAHRQFVDKPRQSAKASRLKAEGAQAEAGRQGDIAEDERIRRLRLLSQPAGTTSTSEQFTGRKTLLGQ